MEDYVPRTHANMNILSKDVLPGMELADGFKVMSTVNYGGTLFAEGLAYGFLPGMRYLGQYPYGMVTIKVQVN